VSRQGDKVLQVESFFGICLDRELQKPVGQRTRAGASIQSHGGLRNQIRSPFRDLVAGKLGRGDSHSSVTSQTSAPTGGLSEARRRVFGAFWHHQPLWTHSERYCERDDVFEGRQFLTVDPSAHHAGIDLSPNGFFNLAS